MTTTTIPVVYHIDDKLRYIENKYIFKENIVCIGFTQHRVNKRDVYVVLHTGHFEFYLADEYNDDKKIFSSIAEAKNFLAQKYKIEF